MQNDDEVMLRKEVGDHTRASKRLQRLTVCPTLSLSFDTAHKNKRKHTRTNPQAHCFTRHTLKAGLISTGHFLALTYLSHQSCAVLPQQTQQMPSEVEENT